MSDLAKDLEKMMGANAEQQQVTCWLDTGYAPLNKILGNSYEHGGFPGGRITEMFGGASSGKTAIATRAMACAQRMGGIPAFMDHENSFDVSLAEQIGLDTQKAWVYKQPESFEESVDSIIDMGRKVRAGKLIAPEAPIIAVFDSLASMIPQSKLKDSKGKDKTTADLGMHDNMALAKATSACFPVLAQMAYKMNICFLFLNQTRVDPTVTHGDKVTTPGGKAPEFYASTRIQLTRTMIKDKSDASKTLGQDIRAYTKKNKVNRPFQEVKWRFMFDEETNAGKFDTMRSTLDHMKDIGLLEMSGSYALWEGKKVYISELAAKLEADDRQAEVNQMLYDFDARK